MCWEFMFSLGCRAAGRGDAPPGQGQTGGCLPVRVGAGDASPSKGKVRGRPPEQGAGGDDSPCGAGQKGIPPRTGVGKGKAPRPQKSPFWTPVQTGSFAGAGWAEGQGKKSETHRYSLETERGRISGFAGEKVQVGSIRSIRFEKVGADIEQRRFHAHAHA